MGFPGNPVVTGAISLSSVVDTYPTHWASLGLGGMMQMDTIANRNLIPVERRIFGMLCTVYADGTPANDKTYMLANVALGGTDNNISNNANWIEFTSGGSTPITTNVIPKGTGASITDGTWAFSSNDIYPSVDGSNIGLSGTNRVGTIYLTSTLDYATNLLFKEVGTERMRIDSGGKVGIGTSSPIAQLDVLHDSGGSASLKSFNVGSDFNASNFYIDAQGIGYFRTKLFVNDVPFAIQSNSNFSIHNSSDRNIKVGTYLGSNIIESINDAANSDVPMFLYASDLFLWTNVGIAYDTGGLPASTRFSVKGLGSSSSTYTAQFHNSTGTSNSLIIRDDGKIGLGTTSPSALLEVGSSLSAATDLLKVTTGASANLVTITSDITSQIKLIGLSSTSYYLTNSYNGTWFEIMGSSLNPLMQINTNGNVGIGNNTTAPTARLEVKGSGATSATFTAKFHDSTGASNTLVISDDTNIGFSTASPQSKLHIYSSPSTNEHIRLSVNGGIALRYKLFLDSSTEDAYYQGFNIAHRFLSGGSGTLEALTIKNGVGINNPSPPTNTFSVYWQQTISITGGGNSLYLKTLDANDSQLSFDVNGGTGNRGRIFVDSTNEYLNLSANNSDIVLYTGASGTTERMRIGILGSVIIGTGVATNATDGFLYVPSCAGTPIGTPTTHSGTVALVYDTTNNKLYVYNGAWKSVTLT